MAHVYISIGSNLDNPADQVRRGIEELRAWGTITAVSPFYRTRPWGPVQDQPHFVNAVLALDTHLDPHDLLAALKGAETHLGRVEGARWGERRIDFDILTYDEIKLESAELTIPHPRMYERAFVLVPLADLDHRYAAFRDGLPQSERDGVQRL